MELRTGMLVYHPGNDPRVDPIYEVIEEDFGPCQFTKKPREWFKARYFLFYAPGFKSHPSRVGCHVDINKDRVAEAPSMVVLARIANGESYAT